MSNTADKIPNPKTLTGDGVGSSSTGIRDASATRTTRNVAPLVASIRTRQSGARSGGENGDPETDPQSGRDLFRLWKETVADDVDRDDGRKNDPDDHHAGPIDVYRRRGASADRRSPLLLKCGQRSKERKCRDCAYEGRRQLQGADSANPHHRGCRIADHAACAAAVSRGDDGGLEVDRDTISVDVARHDPPIMAPAMLSRKIDSPNTNASSTVPPSQPSGNL